VTRPSPTGTTARFRLGVPVTGSYALYGWWPANAGRNSSVPIGIDTPAGSTWIRVDQRKGTGWRYLGTFGLSGGTTTLVRISPRTTTPGTIAADAVKLELVAPRATSGLDEAAQGWAATSRGLSSTADGGVSWESVSPPGLSPSAIRGIRIIGTKGWLVVATGVRKKPLALYSTADRGRTWVSANLPVPSDADVAAPADIEPVDTQLFVGIRLEPNRFGLSRGVLLKSVDGVKWKQSVLPAGGRLSFPTTLDGWLVGGLANEQLYATHDGGKTWKAVRPKPAITGAASAIYAPPVFSTELDGVLPVSLAAGTRSTLAFETTDDGGLTWAPAALVKIGKSLKFGSAVPTAVVDPEYWLAAVGKRLVAVSGAGATRETVGTLPGTVSAIQFASSSTGWAQVAGSALKLFATTDGGVSWTRLKPP
jgi:photosystem II stability/assembly factor-like uncharacterized protein